MSNKKLSIGVVGVRNNGRAHVKRISENQDAHLAAIADVDEERLQNIGEEFGVDRRFTDAGELYGEKDIDAVVLSVPNHLHAPLAIKAMEAGKDVLVEKPISRTADEAREMIEVRDRTGKTLMVGMNQRFSPAMFEIRKRIRQGEIGDIYYAKAHWIRRNLAEGLWGRGDWFLSQELSGGGPLIDLGIHILDRALYLMGFPKVLRVNSVCFNGLGKTEAKKRGRIYEIEDMIVGMIHLEGGAVLDFETSFFHNDTIKEDHDVSIHGTKGIVRGSKLYHVNGEEPREIAFSPPKDVDASVDQHFINVLLGTKKLISTAEQGLGMMRLIEALYESAEKGTSVDLS